MVTSKLKFFFVAILAALIYTPSIQADDVSEWVASLGEQYQVHPNIVYSTANNHDNKLDLYVPRGETQSESDLRPTLIYIHGGGWVGGTKEGL